MLFNINATKQFVLTTCIALTVCSMGCRGSRLGSSGLLGFGGQPSAEALAGNGPTTTYPAPPSEAATPQAIASLAGGTVAPSTLNQNAIAKTSVTPDTPAYAGLDISPGKVAPVTATIPNTAASQANGFYGNTKPANFSVPETTAPQATTPAAPSGYQYGSTSRSGSTSRTPPLGNVNNAIRNAGNAISNAGNAISNTVNSAINKTASAAPAYALPQAIPSPAKTSGPRSNSFAVPDLPAVKTRLTDNPGMSMPGDLAENIVGSVPAAKSVFTPKAPAENASINVSLPNVQVGGNTAQVNIAAAPTAPTVVPQPTANSVWPGSSSGGYSPGSTSNNSGYPAGGYASPSQGSTYR